MKFSAAIAASLGAMVHLAFGAVVINEASYTTVPGACDGNVYVELRNTGSSAVSLAGYVLHDSEGANSPLKYTFPAGSIIAANAIALYCQGDTFQFGISFNDTVSLLDATSSIVSTTGKLWMPYGQSLYTMQRKENGSYRHYGPTPGNATSTTTAGYSPVVISEIADRPVANWCDGHDYVELLNIGPEPVDFSGYVLHDSQGPSSAQAYTFPAGSIIAPKQCLVFCQLTTFQFELSQNTTAGYFGANSANYVNEQVMLRDEIGQVVSAPIVYGTSYRGYETYQRDSTGDYYYRNPTPGHDYGASFIAPPIKPPSRAPSLVAAPTKAPTSQAQVVINEVSFSATTNACPNPDYVELLNTGSSAVDVTGYKLLVYTGTTAAGSYTFQAGPSSIIAPGKVALFCQGQTFQFLIEQTNTLKLRDATAAVVSETTDMRLDASFGTYTSGVLTWQRFEDNEWSHFAATPNRTNFVFSKAPTRAPTTKAPTRAPVTKAPTSAPVKAPTKAPVTKAPTAAPVKSPTSAPVKAPTKAPALAPVKAPTSAPVKAPTAAPVKAPTSAPVKAPTSAPVKAPTKAPTAAPVKAPTAAPVKSPTKAPVKADSTLAPAVKAPVKSPTAAPLKAPTAAPVKAPTSAPKAPTLAPKAPTGAPVAVSSPVRAPVKSPTAAPIQPLEVVRLVVCDGQTGAEVMQLSRTGRSVVSPKKLKAKYFMIKAEVVGAVGSVVFEFDGEKHMENKAPFMFGEKKPAAFVVGSLYAKLPVIRHHFPRNKVLAGNHVIKAIPYATSDGTGASGIPLKVNFRVDRRFQLRASA